MNKRVPDRLEIIGPKTIPNSTADLPAANLSAADLSPSERDRKARNQFVQRLYSRHHDALIGFLRRLLGSEGEAQDIAQESYLRLCRQDDLEKIRGHERSYLFKAAHNLLRDRRRRHAIRAVVQPTQDEISADEVAVETATPLTSLEYKQTVATVQQAMRNMSPEVRQVFLMRRAQTVTYRQIAEQLGISERTVERRMHKALGQLKEELLRSAKPVAGQEGAGKP